MKNFEKIKKWILSHEWAYGPETENDRQKLENGDSIYLYNVYLIGKKRKISLAKEMYNSSSKCVFCWRYPDFSDSMCVYRTFPLNNCSQNIKKWLEMEEGEKVPDDWLKKMKKEDERLKQEEKKKEEMKCTSF